MLDVVFYSEYTVFYNKVTRGNSVNAILKYEFKLYKKYF